MTKQLELFSHSRDPTEDKPGNQGPEKKAQPELSETQRQRASALYRKSRALASKNNQIQAPNQYA